MRTRVAILFAGLLFAGVTCVPLAAALDKEKRKTVHPGDTVQIWLGANYGQRCGTAGPPIFKRVAAPTLGELGTEHVPYVVPSGEHCGGKAYTAPRIWYRAGPGTGTGAALVGALIVAIAGAAHAALPPLARPQLEAAASVVLVGKVDELSAHDERRARDAEDRKVELHVRIESVEKLPKASALSGTVTVRAWTASKRPRGWTGPDGVRRLADVKVGQRVRLFLKGSARAGYDIVEPNGLQILR